ncbi:MAG: methylenetetrahydromethanopterin dehydrogenase [Mariniblastus sp.]|nr:methylenetetrahydromethanopterin dehydrogenase [Mariniblastus sp.]
MKPKILLQIDGDPHPSSFDSIVAVDSGVDQLLTYGSVTVEQVAGLIHGGMFTRGPQDLNRTAAFFGGSDVALTTRLFERARECFFGPIRISMMSDPNGANTTAAAAVLCARRHLELAGRKVVVLGGTGPVGCRIATLAASQQAHVVLASRNREKASAACQAIKSSLGDRVVLEPVAVADSQAAVACLEGVDVLFSAGAAGVELLHGSWVDAVPDLQVAVDLNAVPPAGIGQVEVADRGAQRGNTACYGAIGVGGLKMKIHRQSLQSLFESNEVILELDEIYQIGSQIEAS